MSKVLERRGHTIDDKGFIHYDEVESTIERAEQIVGHRLDRRNNYLIIQGEVCTLAQWTHDCSGCDGGGCKECGYQGKVRDGSWCPYIPPRRLPAKGE